MSTTAQRTVPALIGFSIVLSVVIFFRFSGLSEHLIFSTDQGRALLAGRNILLGDFMLQGPQTSVSGFHLGPLYYYLTAIALWFSQFNPIGPTLMVAGFSVFTAAFLYLYVLQNWDDQRLAIISGLMYAISPLVAWQARIAIEPSPLPFIVICWLWAVTLALKENSRRWWAIASFLPLLGAQLNFSAVTLWVAQFIVLIFHTERISYTWKNRFFGLSGALGIGVLIGKYLWSTPTPLTFWERQWSLWTLPNIPLAAIILFVLASSTIVFWSLSILYRWYYQRPQNTHRLVVMSWILTSIVAFTLKTVGGDHSLGLLYLAPAILIPISIQPLLRPRYFSFSLLGATSFFLLWATHALPILKQPGELTLQDHRPVIEAIQLASQFEPYSFVYRGHLDVYDAADDHYQYLFWYTGFPPAQSARVDLREPYYEQWLYPTPQASVQTTRTLYLYYPADAVNRYTIEGALTIYPESNFALEVVEHQ